MKLHNRTSGYLVQSHHHHTGEVQTQCVYVCVCSCEQLLLWIHVQAAMRTKEEQSTHAHLLKVITQYNSLMEVMGDMMKCIT